MRKQIDEASILLEDAFMMTSVGSQTVQPAHFPGLGSQTFRRNGTTYTNIATKAAVINQLESSLLDAEGVPCSAIAGLPHLAVTTKREGQ